ncbi:MAG: tripartite tricarboxylate transporter substrate binding protein [Deltaproteobacteria bacterium]|nr:tripartite tricarboxylate transporter substrate binding protein [Deltaproteobacteria bacterium]
MARVSHFALALMSFVLVFAASAFAPATLIAQKFPTRPITWIVPYAPGGAFDVLPRGIGPALSKEIGVPVVVQNIPGAEGYNQFFRSRPDGYTIGMVDVVGELAQRLVRRPVYDVTKFEYLGRLNTGVNLFVASPKSPYRKLEDLKKAKERVRCGSFGALSTPTLQCVLLSERLGFPLTIVRFGGPSESIVGTVRGDADIAVLGTILWLDHIAKGNVIPLLLWTDGGDPRLPGVISLKDIGLSELTLVAVQRTVAASPQTPAERRQDLTNALGNAMKSDEVQKFLAERKFETDTELGEPFRKGLASLNGLLGQYEPAIKRFVQSGGK